MKRKQNVTLLLAHGAGAGSQSEFIKCICNKITEKQQLENSLNINVIPFDFEYMKEIYKTGKKRPPERMPKLISTYLRQIKTVESADAIYLLGKSMGARVAFATAELADCDKIRGLVALGYPFYPPGKQDKHRLVLLQESLLPGLIVQGERDTFGNRDWVEQQNLPENIKLSWIEKADHSLKPLKSASISYDQAFAQTADIIYDFIKQTL
ncbi:alpha/beta family hydrolase [Gayadomonas joobiniege]|uniref:alpha/beta family hydrolase n=1 Tax=Gayadomonas joobiniege TaxID=1234606 RepID=UPI000375330C|nr:alpha/beta family hydrolase [Gayadomonas joobiniege]